MGVANGYVSLLKGYRDYIRIHIHSMEHDIKEYIGATLILETFSLYLVGLQCSVLRPSRT